MNRKYAFLSSFWIKIIAFATMTIDHIGWVLIEFVGYNFWLVQPCRYIGRLALPLFCLMIVEGVLHTKHFGKYMLRLGIMGTLISAALIFVEYTPFIKGVNVRGVGNIFVDLILGALTVYLLKRKEAGFKLLALVPLGISIASFAANCYETNGPVVHWFPFFFRMQYDWYSILMCVGFYFAYVLKEWYLEYHERQTGLAKEYLEGSFLDRNITNVFMVGMLIVATMMLFISSFIIPYQYVYWTPDIQNFALISGAFILLYNGKRGYNAKWFEYGSYLYYPLHLLIIYGIAMLVF